VDESLRSREYFGQFLAVSQPRPRPPITLRARAGLKEKDRPVKIANPRPDAFAVGMPSPGLHLSRRKIAVATSHFSVIFIIPLPVSAGG